MVAIPFITENPETVDPQTDTTPAENANVTQHDPKGSPIQTVAIIIILGIIILAATSK